MSRQHVEGFRELEENLKRLSRATGRNALRRAGLSALEPVARVARGMAPKDEGDLSEDIDVGTKLSPRQAGQNRSLVKDGSRAVEVYAGVGSNPAAVPQEFGTIKHPPQAFMRPAWDAEKTPTLNRLKRTMAFEIFTAIQRVQKRGG